MPKVDYLAWGERILARRVGECVSRETFRRHEDGEDVDNPFYQEFESEDRTIPERKSSERESYPRQPQQLSYTNKGGRQAAIESVKRVFPGAVIEGEEDGRQRFGEPDPAR